MPCPDGFHDRYGLPCPEGEGEEPRGEALSVSRPKDIGQPFRVGDAGHGRGLEILDRNGRTVGQSLTYARDEIVHRVNVHDELIAVLDLIKNQPCDHGPGFCPRDVARAALTRIEAVQ